MNVTPIWPSVTSFGLWVRPVRGVTAECAHQAAKLPGTLAKRGVLESVL